MDDNTTQIALALISLVGMFITAIFSFLSLRYASKANNSAMAANTAASASLESSQANHAELLTTQARVQQVKEQTDGITTKLLEATRQMGEAHAEVAHFKGKEEERNHNAEVAAHVADTALKAVAAAASAMPPGVVPVQPVIIQPPQPQQQIQPPVEPGEHEEPR